MSQSVWYDIFKNQLNGLEEAFQKQKPFCSLLKFALDNKFLSPQTYFNWAKEFYELPVLNSNFFKETRISQEMFARWATHYQWSDECLPVAEWDGTLIVACLHPPQDFPQSDLFTFVLSESKDLEYAWKELKGDKSEPNKVSAEIPEGINLSSVTKSRIDEDDLFGLKDIEPNKNNDLNKFNSENLQANEVPEEEKLDGLLDEKSLSQTVIKLQILDLKSTQREGDDVEIVQSLDEEWDNQSISRASGDHGQILNFEKSDSQTADSLTTLEILKTSKTKSFTDGVNSIFNSMRQYFDKSLVLTIDQAESHLKVIASDDKFKNIKDMGQQIPLGQPSIFNIVHSTLKPFHGYVSSNSINDNFFNCWNGGAIPPHVTITPIIYEKHFIGMIMGFGENTASSKESLKFTEKISSDFVNNLANAA